MGHVMIMNNLFDARICFGANTTLDPVPSFTVDDVRRVLDRYAVGRAFLVSYACCFLDVATGNRLVFEAAAADPRLIPCPAVIPNVADELGDEETVVDDFIERGARCVLMAPKTHRFSVAPRVAGRLLRTLAARRLPVLVGADDTDWAAIGDMAAEYPDLPVIVSPARYRTRDFFAVMRECTNIHVGIGPPFAMNRGIEEITRRFGPDRIVFSSNAPEAEPGAAIACLAYADISDDIRNRIASGTLTRLTEEVRHG